ncbi:transcriptional regulator [Lottiidibacillus patelloidae]|uniref:Transcriptional regulator n=1 Tax=Lottiidibacillus patelloidae TaxID=2670334 RepID=A0A263BUE1_9BACI|nr:transcriptional regulator SplA domain-containing protein [Lottiidibacillus patelloidae]OZM57361.1 transcriptional regulator [Lottiidibacillus patelloidae]
MNDPNNLKAGEDVYVIYRNPHIPSVANVAQAEIVEHPKDPNQVALFLHETFHTIEDDDAIYTSEEEANTAYEEMVKQQNQYEI